VALVAAAALVASVVQASTGIGFALVLGPSLFALLDPESAIVALTVLGIALNLLVLFAEQRRPDVAWREVGPLLAAAAPGAVLGVVLLRALPKAWLQIGVGVAVIVAAVLRERARREEAEPTPGDPRARLALGFATGTLTTSAGVNGPPIALWLAHRGLGPSAVRDSLGAAFLGLGIIGAIVLTPCSRPRARTSTGPRWPSRSSASSPGTPSASAPSRGSTPPATSRCWSSSSPPRARRASSRAPWRSERSAPAGRAGRERARSGHVVVDRLQADDLGRQDPRARAPARVLRRDLPAVLVRGRPVDGDSGRVVAVRHDAAAADGRVAVGAEDLHVLVDGRVAAGLVDDDDAVYMLTAVAGQRDDKRRAAEQHREDRERERKAR
jgi:uncharacterized protein